MLCVRLQLERVVKQRNTRDDPLIQYDITQERSILQKFVPLSSDSLATKRKLDVMSSLSVPTAKSYVSAAFLFMNLNVFMSVSFVLQDAVLLPEYDEEDHLPILDVFLKRAQTSPSKGP